MAIAPGTRLGVYEVTAQIGEGGMGQVYRATDTKLKRQVAIKVLPASVAGDADRLARFQREAEVLAALNHPNIAAIYGLETGQVGREGQEGLVGPFLVMELVEGEDLSERIARLRAPGASARPAGLPLDEALPIARQIAEALEAAHAQGIIHRDLKPANIKVRPDGTVKVLDFGLAKVMDAGAGGPGGAGRPGRAAGVYRPDSPDRPDRPDLSASPTLTSPAMTQAGMILGTAAYMSPEQARGRTVDKRSDVWAFGCVLFEMLTGRRAFQGSDVSETLANIIKAEPEWTALREDVPAAVRRSLRRCLEKESTRRLRDIGDARLDLEDAIASPAESTDGRSAVQAALARSKVVFAAAAVLLALLGVVAGVSWSSIRGRTQPTEPIWVSIPPPGGPLGIRLGAVVSPDGTQLAFWAPDATGVYRLWVRSLNAPEARSLPGTDGPNDATGARLIAWSPDGQSLAFIARGKLARITLAGGSPQPLADAGVSPRGLAWSSSGVILYVPTSAGSGIHQIAASGGTPELLEVGSNPLAAEWPAFMPDGRHFVFFVTNLLADLSEAGIYVGSLDSTSATRINTVLSRPDYADGHLFFVRAGALFAQRFDEATLATTGEPFRVAEGVGAMGGDRPAYSFSVSASGTIALSDAPYLPSSQLTWLDRSGRTVKTVGEPGEYFSFAMSPDEASVAVERAADAKSPTTSLWMMSRGSGALSLLTPNGASPLWDATNDRLVYQVFGTRLAGRLLRADREEPIAFTSAGPRPWPEDVSRDGRTILFRSDSTETQSDLWALASGGGASPTPYLHSRANESQARFSPDGRWVAYTSDESGQDEVYIQSFPEPRLKQRVSTGGGIRPLWRQDGREVYYLDPAQRFMAARVDPAPEGIAVSAPAPLFAIAGLGSASTYRHQIEVSATGDRFLFNLLVPQPRPTTITVILNWKPPAH